MSLTSDEVNFLVYRYLQESGFVHSAFVFAYESLVGRADIASADIPPGALISFLQKGLQYVEIERELETSADGMGNCLTNGMTLLSAAKVPKDLDKDDPMETSDTVGVNANSSSSSSSTANVPSTTLGLDNKANAGNTVATEGWLKQEDVTELRGHATEVLVCSWNPQCDLLASGSGDSTVRLWDIPRGASGLPAGTSASANSVVLYHKDPGGNRMGNKDVTTLDWRSNGEELATGSFNGTARIWTMKGELKHTLERHGGTVFSMRWNPSGNFLLSGSVDKVAVVWDTTTGKVKQAFTDHTAAILDVDWRDDETFATCSTDKMIHVCNVGEEKPQARLSGHTDEVNSIKWSPDGSLLASCSDDFTAKIWNHSQGSTPLQSLDEHTNAIYQIKWQPPTTTGAKSSMLATASFDSTVRLWDAETGKSLQTLTDHERHVYSVAFSPNGRYLASGSMDYTLRIWDVNLGKCVRKYKGGGGIYEVCWNKDGDKVAACFSVPSMSVCIIDFRS